MQKTNEKTYAVKYVYFSYACTLDENNNVVKLHPVILRKADESGEIFERISDGVIFKRHTTPKHNQISLYRRTVPLYTKMFTYFNQYPEQENHEIPESKLIAFEQRLIDLFLQNQTNQNTK